MKKYLIYISALCLFWACNDPLDKRNLNAVDSEDVWDDFNLAILVVNDAINRSFPTFAGISNIALSDESKGSGTGDMMFGLLTKDDEYGIYSTATFYKLREVNMLIEEIPDGEMSQEEKDQILGQSYFIRAWLLWELVKYYGGVPLVTFTVDPADFAETQLARSSAKECVNQIVEDLDYAASILPATWESTDYGRPTKETAYALKGRVLLFYASPQFNPDNDQERWQTAYNANKIAYDSCLAYGYALYDDFANIFIDEDKANEAIFFKCYNGVDGLYHTYENSVRPRYASNTKSSVSSPPNWDLVKSFPMADGLPIEGHPDYDSVYFWKNRDPRFYATIAYNGMGWSFTEIETDKLWTYYDPTDDYNKSTSSGLSPTGFFLKKNVNTTIERTQTVYTPTDWIEIRLAEVYLNLAECAAETNQLAEAKSLLCAIRERADIESGDGSYGITASSKDEMVEAVMLERKIELAFENKRHWDMRRRNMYISDLNNTPKMNGTRRHGLDIELDTAYIFSIVPSIPRFDTVYTSWDTTLSASDSVFNYFQAYMADTIDLETQYHLYFKTEVVELESEDINYLQPKYNFYYIDDDYLAKNLKLQQTINWTDVDPFDPLDD